MRKMATDLLHVREDCKRLEVCIVMLTLIVNKCKKLNQSTLAYKPNSRQMLDSDVKKPQI